MGTQLYGGGGPTCKYKAISVSRAFSVGRHMYSGYLWLCMVLFWCCQLPMLTFIKVFGNESGPK